YWKLLMKVRETRQQVGGHGHTTRVYHAIIAVTVSLFILIEPIAIHTLFMSYHVQLLSPHFNWCFVWLALLNSTLTPLWYYAFSTPFKEAYWRVLRRLFCTTKIDPNAGQIEMSRIRNNLE